MIGLLSIKIDRYFPELGTSQLERAINNGFVVWDKNTDGRYIIYIMKKDPELADVGKTNFNK